MPDNRWCPEPTVFMLFGATGDLAHRLVLPAFFRLAQAGLLPDDWRLVGNGRGNVSHEDFQERVRKSLEEFGPKPSQGPWKEFRVAPALRRRRVRGRQPGEPSRRPRARRKRTSGATLSASIIWPCRLPRSARSPRASAITGWPSAPGSSTRSPSAPR